ncbi:hypothetical protein PoB_004475100 [Plakobranchus ocellatus]|uniref:Uncharacterized protein n=1 Tax=Plakobranchus ocellatus TaxID=259542 RepID=A0AAV4BCW2_9GAST|nr:hypothetical protein PoB_004475100 [Plakobranchus ocellatus]
MSHVWWRRDSQLYFEPMGSGFNPSSSHCVETQGSLLAKRRKEKQHAVTTQLSLQTLGNRINTLPVQFPTRPAQSPGGV